MMVKICTRLILLGCLFYCRPLPTRAQSSSGIKGRVLWVSGNHMPSPDRKAPPDKGIKTTLYIFELTNLSQVTRKGESAFYISIRTNLLKTVHTDTSGYFKVYLPPGHYSLFCKKGELYYANWFDSSNDIAPVQVTAQEMTQVTFKIDYDASY
jgi:hypothetical protein